MLFCVELYGWLVVFILEGLLGKGSTVEVLGIDALVDFAQDVMDFLFLDAFEERDWESPHVHFILDQDVGKDSAPDHAGLLWVGPKFVLSEEVINRGHPTVVVLDGVFIEDRNWLLYAWSGKNFLNDGLVSSFLFRAREFGQDVCLDVVFVGDVPHFYGGKFCFLFFYQVKYSKRLLCLTWYSPWTWRATSWEFMHISTFSAPRSSVSHMPARKALYSAWLLEVGKNKVSETSTRIPSPFSRMMPAPPPG